MGGGRKTKTIQVPEKPPPSPPTSNANRAHARKLPKSELGAVIFSCKKHTKDECLSKQLFGAPSAHFAWVRNITPGMPLFLFNFSARRLLGIFEAASAGAMNIDPYAWTKDGKQRTEFPAQVRIRVRKQCDSLTREEIQEVIRENYFTTTSFWFELDHKQTNALIALFKPSAPGRIPPGKTNPFPALQSSKKKAPLKSAKSSGSGRKREPGVSCSSVIRNKFASLSIEGGDKEHTEEGEFGETALNCEIDGVEQPWDPSWSKMQTWVLEDGGSEVTLSDWGKHSADESVHGSHSSAILHQDGESHIHLSSNETSHSAMEKTELEEPNSCKEAYSMEKNMQDSLNADPPCDGGSQILVVQHDNSSINGHEESMLCEESSALVEEEQKTIINRSGDDVRIELPKDLFALAEEEESDMSSDLYNDSELVQIAKELKERTIALEKKQHNSDLEIQRLRDVVKGLESRLSLVGVTSNKFAQFMCSEKFIYLLGGFNGTTWLSTLDSFSSSTDIIKHLKPMSCARSYASAAALNGKLYVFGGGYASSWFDSVECYSPAEGNWSFCPNLIRPKGGLAGATSNDKIYAIGGGDGQECFSEVEMLDLTFGKWINIQPMFEKRFATAAAELNGMIYTVGGYNGQTYLQSVEMYDPRHARWTRFPNMATKRGCHSLAVLNEKLYAVGGYDGEKMTSSIEVFDPRSGSWMMDEPMSFPRGYFATAVLDDSLFVIGGVTGGVNMVDVVECYKEGNGWATTSLKSIGRRCFHSAVVF